jgi:type IV pilus assembly protein PilV
MKGSTRNQSWSAGFVLLEVLIAILIFSIGIVGLIGLQAMSAKNSTDAKYRSEAALLVNQLIGNMWASNRTIAALQSNFNTGGAGYNTWLSSVTATLPGVTANSATAPTVTVDSAAVVSIAVHWIAPSDVQSGVAHSVTTVTQIK